MSDAADWRVGLGAAARFDNIQKILSSILASGSSSGTNAQKDAFAAETEAYNNAATKHTKSGQHQLNASQEEYEATCASKAAQGSPVKINETLVAEVHRQDDEASAQATGVTIGNYEHCSHIASGMVSEVYKSNKTALKVITETHNVEPHDAHREVRILKLLNHPNIVKLLNSFHDSSQHLVLVFPLAQSTLSDLLSSPSPLTAKSTHRIATSLFSALSYLHAQKIIHRDVKPSNILLTTQQTDPSDPSSLKLADFGTAWHPTLSRGTEAPESKILEVGTTCYRAPETLFGNRAYTTAVDVWATGCVLTECLRQPAASAASAASAAGGAGTQPDRKPTVVPLFASRRTDEDGNQLGLILSMFKTLGTPTESSWPEAAAWKTNPFTWYNEFPGTGWGVLLADCEGGAEGWGGRLVRMCVDFESGRRVTADEALEFLSCNGPR